MDRRGLITEANRNWWMLGAAMAMGCAVTAVGAVIAALVIRGRPKHELAAHGAPELPRAARALAWRGNPQCDARHTSFQL